MRNGCGPPMVGDGATVGLAVAGAGDGVAVGSETGLLEGVPVGDGPAPAQPISATSAVPMSVNLPREIPAISNSFVARLRRTATTGPSCRAKRVNSLMTRLRSGGGAHRLGHAQPGL